jgi:predicted RNase H-like HicB family nuclease
MKQTKFSGNWDHGNDQVDVQLTLIQFEEDGRFIVYTPSLDLSGYGNTEEEATASYAEAIDEFLRYTTNKKTLPKVLTKLGWSINRKNKIKAPPLVQMINENKYLAEIFEEKQYKKLHQTVKLPAFA